MLSSQIACLNHLFAIRNDADSVLSVLNNICNEFIEVLPIPSDKTPTYIVFEIVSDEDHLNESTPNRGSNCTFIDTLFYARHKSGELWIIPIEWKYTEYYNNQDLSEREEAKKLAQRYRLCVKSQKWELHKNNKNLTQN